MNYLFSTVFSFYLILIIQLSNALPIGETQYSTPKVASLDESFSSPVSTYVSSLLDTHKITVPQPKIKIFSLRFDLSSPSSEFEEAIISLRSFLNSIFTKYDVLRTSQTLDAEENEEVELVDHDCHSSEETSFLQYSQEQENYDQPQENMSEFSSELFVIDPKIRILDIQGHGDMVVVGVVVLFLIICITLEIPKRWRRRMTNSYTDRITEKN